MGESTNQQINLSTLLRSDPAWTVFALADLHPRFANVCRWTVTESAVILFWAGITPPILITHGPAAEVEAALAQIELPERVYLSVREEHLPAIQRWYDTSVDYRPMWRMVAPLTPQLWGEPATTSPKVGGRGALVRLGVEDAVRIEGLFAHGGDFTPDAFDPAQLADGTFWGVEESGNLIAAGGTHVVDTTESVAVIGNIYTHPDHRGRRYGRIVTLAIVKALQQQGIQLIALNVDQRNTVAADLYTNLGFRRHCPYVEGVSRLHR